MVLIPYGGKLKGYEAYHFAGFRVTDTLVDDFSGTNLPVKAR